MNKINEHRHFNKRADDSGKGLAGVNSEYGNSHRDGKLKVIRCGGKRERRGLTVVGL